MSNVLSEEKRHQVIASGRLGWPLRRIENEIGRIQGILGRARRHGAALTDNGCAAALEIGVSENPYRLVRRWLERRPQLTLRQVDPIIIQLSLYRDLIGIRSACDALSVPLASYYRWQGRAATGAPTKRRPRPVRALPSAEQETVQASLHEERFQDLSPAPVYATRLDKGHYHCSIRTMYRLLEERGESRERRDQLTHPPYQKPEFLATAPNQLWSWHNTKLLAPA